MIGDNPNDADMTENELIGNPTPRVAGTYFREWEFFRTEAQTTSEGTIPYPSEDDEPAANTYYARLLKNVKYDQEQGAPTLTYDLTNHFVFIKNMARSGNYLPENSIVIGFQKSGLWYTIDDQKGVANDYGMVAYTFGSYVVVLDDRDGSVVWGPTLITHERYTAHPDASDWEIFRGAFLTNNGAEVEGMTYLKAQKAKFDRRGNLFVAYDLSEWVDSTGLHTSPTGNLGAVITSGMIRFDYDLHNRTFVKSWQKDVSKWVVANVSGRAFTASMGWFRATSNWQHWAAFDVDDDGAIFFAAFGWQADPDSEDYVEHDTITTQSYFAERYSIDECDTTLGATWMVKLDASSGDELWRLKAGEVLGAQLQPAQTSFDVLPKEVMYCYPVWLGDVKAMGNGRVYLMSRAVAEFGYREDFDRRRDESGEARAIQNKMMQIDTAGIWRDFGRNPGGIFYTSSERHDAVAYEWRQNPEAGMYYVRAMVSGDFDQSALITPGPLDGCKVSCEAETTTARALGRCALLLDQPTDPFWIASGFSWQSAVGNPAAGSLPCNAIAFGMCRWIRSGTFGFPIVNRTGYQNKTTNSCDLHGTRALIAMSSPFTFVDTQGNQRISQNLWLSQALNFQPLPSDDQAEESWQPANAPHPRTGFRLTNTGRFGSQIRYDSNDDGGGNNGSAIWSFEFTPWTFLNVEGLVEQRHRVYKINQSGSVVWHWESDNLNPSHQLYGTGAGGSPGSLDPYVPLAGEGLGTSIDIYDPRENPDSPNYEATFQGRRFVPDDEDQAPPSPPDV